MTTDSEIEALVEECRRALAYEARARGEQYEQAQQRVREVAKRLAATPGQHAVRHLLESHSVVGWRL